MKPLFSLLILIVLIGCTQEPVKKEAKINFDPFEDPMANDKTVEPIEQQTPENVETQINNEDGPPFSDTCLCNFENIGEYRISEDRFDLVLSGRGWNPRYWSCSWIWGELIYNRFPPDTLVTDFRIHLVNLEEIDSNTFASKVFEDNLIATFSRLPNEKYMTCKFDPNKTGKFPKPEQWAEQ